MKKQNILNWTITGLFLLGLIICYFFWACNLDMIVTIIAAVVAVFSIVLLSKQNGILKKLSKEEEKQ